MSEQQERPATTIGALLPVMLTGGAVLSSVGWLVTSGILRTVLGTLSVALLAAGVWALVTLWLQLRAQQD